MSQAFSAYRRMEYQLATLRREKKPEATIQKHLEAMDDAWYKLTYDEKQELAQERDESTSPSSTKQAAPTA